jgi:hypothetical protein
VPAALVKGGDSQRRQEHVVGEKYQGLAGVGILEADARHAHVARVALHNECKARPGNEVHDLREERLADIHGSSPGVWTPGNYTTMRVSASNRHQNKSAASRQYNWLSEQLTPV